jgi:molecular chaperone GrpE (heat shock protein)
MSKSAAHSQLASFIEQIDFDSEHYYNLYFESADDVPSDDVSAEVWTNLSTVTADMSKLRGEFARLRRGVEQLRMPAIEAIGLDRVVEQLQNLERRFQPVAAALSKPDPDEGLVRRLLKDLLAVVDTVERVFDLQLSQPSAVSEGMRVGLESLQRLLMDTLKRYGLQRMELEPGSRFDPELQMAMSTEPSSELADGTVSQILVSGYTLGEQVFRTAQVVVVRNG